MAQTQHRRDFAVHLGKSIRRVLPTRMPVRLVQFTIVQCPLYAEGAPGQIFLRGGPLCVEVGKKASVISQLTIPSDRYIEGVEDSRKNATWSIISLGA